MSNERAQRLLVIAAVLRYDSHMPSYEALQAEDKAVYDALMGEMKRQKEGVELIASENYISPAVMEAMGTVFNNKYSEGYPGKRYYAGQEFTDAVEKPRRTLRCTLPSWNQATP